MTEVEELQAKLVACFAEALESTELVPYTDEGAPLLRSSFEEFWAGVPDAVKQSLAKVAASMTAEELAAFSDYMIQDGPSVPEQLLNAIPEEE